MFWFFQPVRGQVTFGRPRPSRRPFACAVLRSEVQHLDVLKYTNKVFRHLYSKAYIDLVNNAPEVLGWLYDYLDDPRKNDPIRAAFDRLNANPFIRYLSRYQPDVAICTHFLPSGIISSLKGEGKVKVLNTVVVTDFDVHAMWLCRHVEQYFVALEETKVHLKAMGVADSLVTVSGIPIDPVFTEPKDKRAMRRKHGLDQDRFTILVSAGGFGVGPVGHLMQALARLSHPAQVVAVCGRNEALKAELTQTVKQLAKPSVVSFKLLGFTTEMDELMTAADLFVGKPGGLTTSEVLVQRAFPWWSSTRYPARRSGIPTTCWKKEPRFGPITFRHWLTRSTR